VSNSERKTKIESPAMISKSWRTQRRPIEARLQGHAHRVKATDRGAQGAGQILTRNPAAVLAEATAWFARRSDPRFRTPGSRHVSDCICKNSCFAAS
jgi:hypothetical protein